MSRATPEMRRLAQRLIASESRGTKSGTAIPAAALVCEKLRPVFATMMGNGGFCGLLRRALALASVEAAWWKNVRVGEDGSLEGLQEMSTQIDARKMEEGGVVLIAQLLGLLNAFIGEDLTVRFVSEAWPRLSLDGPNPGSGEKK